jgi:hypothetical protein
MWTCSWIPTFRRNRVEDGDNMFPRNVSIYVQIHTALQPIRPTSKYLGKVYSVLQYVCDAFLGPVLRQPAEYQTPWRMEFFENFKVN